MAVTLSTVSYAAGYSGVDRLLLPAAATTSAPRSSA
jgi:hypothetical protein